MTYVYGAGHVTYVRNFTDVDDKINAEAQRRKGLGDPRSLEELIRERTEETIRWYHDDMDALGALRPTLEPRATDYIGQMIGMIEGLVASGHAYERDGHVLFRVRSYKDYGRLSGRSVDDMIAGARVEVAPFKEDPMDFVLWKPSDADLPGWQSPWGRGRPGWHIECSAMSHELLGESFDIHGGGIDLQFPHHENEIAQSACAHPEADFARVWMHNEMLMVEGRKMSKSLGNFFTVRDLLDRGVPGEVIRFVMLMTHYSKPMDWTEEKARAATDELSRWRRHVDLWSMGVGDGFNAVDGVMEALADDLNTPAAITAMRAYERTHLRGRETVEAEHVLPFAWTLRFLGLDGGASDHASFPDEVRDAFRRFDITYAFGKRIDAARAAKDFAEADRLKALATSANFEVQITRSGAKLNANLDSDYEKLGGFK